MNISLVYSSIEYQNQTALLLDEAGYTVNQTFSIASPWFASINRDMPELLVISTNNPDSDLYQQLSILGEQPRCPIIIIAHSTDHHIIEKTILSGADTCIVGELSADRLQSVVEIAIARYKATLNLKLQLVELKQELATLEGQISDRQDIDRAKGLLMKSYNMSETDAYTAMRNMAIDSGNKLCEVARNLISMSKLLN